MAIKSKTKRCGFRFNCALMMQQPGLEPNDCPNHEACGHSWDFEYEDEPVTLSVTNPVSYQIEFYAYQRLDLAELLLNQRGASQLVEDFEIGSHLTWIQNYCLTIENSLQEFTGKYIAPNNCEAHRYNVKRPKGTYWYNKLTSTQQIFEPQIKDEKVKVIHLSHDSDPRNIVGRLGIHRRNRLAQAKTQLAIAQAALEQAAALLAD